MILHTKPTVLRARITGGYVSVGPTTQGPSASRRWQRLLGRPVRETAGASPSEPTSGKDEEPSGTHWVPPLHGVVEPDLAAPDEPLGGDLWR